MTSGIPPRWRIGCSRCGHGIVGTPGPGAVERSADIVPLPVPARRPGRALSVPVRAALPARIEERRQQELARRLRVIRRSARTSTGISLAAVCGIAVAAVILDRGPAPVTDVHVDDGAQLAAAGPAAPAAAPGGPTAPVYTHPPLTAPSRTAIPGVPEAATAAAGDPGVASIVDLDQPLPEIYPDPREGMAALALAERNRTDTAAQTEDALALSVSARREVQRRLQLARHDPQSIDGIFGPMTRTALADWQAQAGLPATGYLDEPSLALLVERTDADYHAWRAAEKQRKDSERIANASPVPRPDRSMMTEPCPRENSGSVAYGRSVRCDFRGLRESVGTLRENLASLFERPEEPSPWARRHEKIGSPGA